MRRLDRLIALILGIAAAAVAVLAGIEIVLLAASQPPLLVPRHAWDRSLHGLHWTSIGAGVASGILLVVGVFLLLLQLIPRRPVRLPLRSLAGERAFLNRRGLARRLTLEAADLDEVSAVKVRVTGHTVRAKAALAAGVDRRAGTQAVRGALQATLAHVAPAQDLRLRVRADVKDPPLSKRSRKARLDDPNIGRPSTEQPEHAA